MNPENRHRWRCGWLAAPLLCLSVPVAAGDLVLVNGNIHTGHDAQPQAEAVVAEAGRISYVGSTDEALRRAPQGAQVVDLGGLTVLPGLTDAHAHLAGIGFRELRWDLAGIGSLAELQRQLRAQAAADPGDGWITGRGWLESGWTPPAFPSRADLDAVVADRPVALERGDGHALVANSRALQLAGIDGDTPDPPGGQILRDPDSGEPTGLLVDAAMALIERLVPAADAEQTRRALEVAGRRSVQLGWTQLQIAGTTWDEIEALCGLYAEDRMPLRLYAAIGGPGADAGRLLREAGPGCQCGGRLPVRAIKLYMDGALGSRGAALLAPYSDRPDTRGLLVNEPETVLEIMKSALRRGIQMQVHAIGDRGNRLVLDLMERAHAEVPPSQRALREPRWRVEHAQVVDPADWPRFARLGVIASMQPSHAISDMLFAPARLGPARLRGAYAWRSLLGAGAMIAAGSDAPVERGDPLIEFYAAVTRRALDGTAGEDWGLDERVSREQALKMLTLWPAVAAFQEQDRGTIEPGKLADFSVFSADIMRVPPEQILQARAVMTVVGGRVVYAAIDTMPASR